MAEKSTAEARKTLQENGVDVAARGILSAEQKAKFTELTGDTVAAPAAKSE